MSGSISELPALVTMLNVEESSKLLILWNMSSEPPIDISEEALACGWLI
jgi:hypothetical protein